jgi:hypothetical protein
MWCLLAGKLTVLISYSIVLQTIKSINELNSLNTILGWFLIEHLFEEYNKTAGKFFLINRDFRDLIKNVLIVIRNVVGFAYFLTLLELLLGIFLLIILIYCLYYLFFINKVKGVKNEMLILVYYSFIIYILLVKFIMSLNWFDVCFLVKSFVIFYLNFLVLYCFYLAISFLFNQFKHFSKKLKLKSRNILLVRIPFYSLNVCFFFINLFFIISFASSENNNVIQELFVKMLLFYSFIYYKV